MSEPKTRPPQLLPRLLSTPQKLSYAHSMPVIPLPATPMNPVERLATWLWDRHGDRRRAQAMRLARTERARRQRRESHSNAAHQIERLQAIAAQLEDERR